MATTIQEQLALEHDMVSDGASRYREMLKKNEDAGRSSENDYAIRQMRDMVEPMVDALREKCERNGPSRNGKITGMLRDTDYQAACFIALQLFFNECAGGTDTVLTTLCGKIGQRVEDDLKFKKFRDENVDYVDAIIADFKRKGTQNYRHKHRVLTKKANDRDLKWNNWTEKERVQTGLVIMNALMLTSDAAYTENRWRGSKTFKYILMSDTLMNWIEDNKEFMSQLYPHVGPCIVEPDPWTSYSQGGFYLPQMRKRFPLVKTHVKPHRTLLESADLSLVYSAVNRAQSTAWHINGRVLAVMQEVWKLNLQTGMPASEPIEVPTKPECIPDGLKQEDMSDDQLAEFLPWKVKAAAAYSNEKERRSKLSLVSRALQVAEKHKDYEAIWFVHQCDFRGRIYPASPGLSPQGADQARGLLQFCTAKELGPNGLYWLKVHTANKYGHDKDTYDGRVKFIDAMLDDIKAIAEDPVGQRGLWGIADKPYQFLSCCIEIAEAHRCDDPSTYKSRTPIARDGTCNGLQNFSGMLRDEVGGAAVNLLPNDIPADIYGAVATVLEDKLVNAKHPMGDRWIAFGVDRHLCKTPVMTLPYGSTRRTCTDNILLHIYKINKRDANDFFGKETWAAAQYLTPLLWDSIGEVVVKAREAMKWLQTCASILAKDNIPMVWKAPNGFPVYQGTPRYKTEIIQTMLLGFLKTRMRVYVRVPTKVLDPRKQSSGSAPNFIHSMDASHMMAVLNYSKLDSVAMIHDDFGCHACYVDEFDKHIRQAFYDLYTGKDMLGGLYRQFCKQSKRKIPKPPKHGALDLAQVLKSPYFFG